MRGMRHPSQEGDVPELPEAHEINVTPFIDVMLVLLIVFMIAAPLTTVDLPVELPEVAAPLHQPTGEPIYLTLQLDSSLALGDRRLTRDELPRALAEASGGDRAVQIFLRADHRVSYGALMALLEKLRRAGYSRLALMGSEHSPPTDARSASAR